MPFGAPGYTPGTGYVLQPCQDCTRSMWIGPKQLEKHKTDGSDTVCVFCAIKRYGPEAIQGKIKPLAPGDNGSRFQEP